MQSTSLHSVYKGCCCVVPHAVATYCESRGTGHEDRIVAVFLNVMVPIDMNVCMKALQWLTLGKCVPARR